MDLLDVALTRFEQLAPALKQPETMTEVASDDCEAWLRGPVCAVVARLVSNERFRRLTRWSVDRLGQGAGTPERTQVETVDSALVRLAEATVAAKKEFLASSESPTVDNSHLDYLAGHPWFDLVDPGDFFLCTNGMMWASAPEEWWGLYYREPDPRIPLGDYVCRAMLRRIEVLSRLLEPLWRGAFETAQHRGPSAHGTASHLFDAKVHLDPAIEVLRRLCHPADARLREACCTLTQIAAAYDPNPDLAWLGHPQWPSEAIARLIRTYIRPREEVFSNEGNGNGIATVVNRQGVPRCLPAMISGVAESLMTVKELYRRPIDPSDLIETLRHERRLLLVDSRPRAIFWDGNKLPADWDDNVALFDLLWKIAVFRKHNKQPIAEQLSGDGKKGSLKHRRLRLKTHLPKDLDSLIQSARPGSYCLHLGPESISTLRLDDDMQPIEVGLEAALDI